MTIKVIYNGRDFFGQSRFAEETKDYATIKDLRKCFRAMKQDREFAIHVNNFTIFWDSYSDFENGIVGVREYAAWNSYDEMKLPWDEMKKEIIARLF